MQPTQPLLGRLRQLGLTTKQARKGFFKGTGTRQLGAWDPRNPKRFIPDFDRIRTYVVPDPSEMAAFPLKPFVAANVNPKIIFEGNNRYYVAPKHFTGEDYLDFWIERGGNDDAAVLREMRRSGGWE